MFRILVWVSLIVCGFLWDQKAVAQSAQGGLPVGDTVAAEEAFRLPSLLLPQRSPDTLVRKQPSWSVLPPVPRAAGQPRIPKGPGHGWMLWWVLLLLSAFVLARNQGFYPTCLHALVNSRIFLQQIRSRNVEGELTGRLWDGLFYVALAWLLLPTLPPETGEFDLLDLVVPSFAAKLLRLLGISFLLWLGVRGINAWAGLWGWSLDWNEWFSWYKGWNEVLIRFWLPLLLVGALPLMVHEQATNQVWFLAGGALLVGTVIWRWLRLFQLTYAHAGDRLFFLVFYICTFEILPLLILTKIRLNA